MLMFTVKHIFSDVRLIGLLCIAPPSPANIISSTKYITCGALLHTSG